MARHRNATFSEERYEEIKRHFDASETQAAVVDILAAIAGGKEPKS